MRSTAQRHFRPLAAWCTLGDTGRDRRWTFRHRCHGNEWRANMIEHPTLEQGMIDELERAGTEPSAIRVRPTSRPGGSCRSAPAPRSLGQRVLVLQGGGALGAYQVGVYQALHEAGIEPDWVVGTSIGAINASLIAGSDPAERLDRLEEFWSRMGHGPLHHLFGALPSVGQLAANMLTVSAGIAAFFRPNPWAFMSTHMPLGPDAAGYY